MNDDPRIAAARYRARQDGVETEDAEPDEAPVPTERERAAYVETVIQQAIRRGDFDNLRGAGKPIADLGPQHDPDWWIKRKIREEQLTGLGPPALTLRIEHAEFDARADALAREEDVREYVTDFNRRVIEARRQLQGGPPVVTPTRDVESEVAAWRQRRADAAATAAAAPPATTRRRRRLFRR